MLVLLAPVDGPALAKAELLYFGGIEINSSFELGEIGIACRSDVTVLLTGPTGSGKTRLAKQIHVRSKRSERPLWLSISSRS